MRDVEFVGFSWFPWERYLATASFSGNKHCILGGPGMRVYGGIGETAAGLVLVYV